MYPVLNIYVLHLSLIVYQEFNSSQRSAFCVYSGDGVEHLRRYLQQLFNSITEDINQCDDYDGDDDGYVAAYNHVDQDDAEMETELEIDDGDGDIDGDFEMQRPEIGDDWQDAGRVALYARAVEPDSDMDIVLPALNQSRRPNDTGRHQYEILRLTNPPTSRGHTRPSQSNAHASSSGSAHASSSTTATPQARSNFLHPSYTAFPGSSQPQPSEFRIASPPLWNTTPTQSMPSAPAHGGSGTLSPTLQALAQANGGQRRFFGHGGNNASQGQQAVFSPPTQPTSTSPAASEGSAANFFRTYGSRGGAVSPGSNGSEARGGAGTPDLVFAELGHGRGGGAAGAHAMGEPGVIGSGRPGHGHSFSQPNTNRGGSGGNRSRGVGASGSQVTGPLTRALQESVHAAFSGSPAGPSGSSAPSNTVVDGRGRSMKRTFRNTMNAMEQTASSLFGGGGMSARRQDDVGDSQAGMPSGANLGTAPVRSPFASEGRGSGDVWMGVGDNGEDDMNVGSLSGAGKSTERG